MKMRNYIGSTMFCLLVVACSTKNGPAVNSVKKIQSPGIVQESVYEQAYSAFITSAIPMITELDDVHSILNGEIGVSITAEDTTYQNISSIVESYQLEGTISSIIEQSLLPYHITWDIDEIEELNSSNITSLLTNMQDSLYITYSYRQVLFDNSQIEHNEKLFISLLCALNNWLYEKANGRTIVVKDLEGNYFITQAPITNDIICHYTYEKPLDIYEITIDHVDNFDEADLLIYLQTEIYSYMDFDSHLERALYLETLDYDYTYSLTRADCDNLYYAKMDDVEMNVAGTMLGAFVSSGGNPYVFGGAVVSMSIYWCCSFIYYRIDRKRCLDRIA